MATRIDRLWPGRPRPGQQPRLRWALPSETQWDRCQSMEQMWREIAAGTRPCLCAVSLEERHGARRSLGRESTRPVNDG